MSVAAMPDLAKVFRSGNSHAVRFTEAFRFDVDQVEVTREGDAVILRPHVEAEEPWPNAREVMRRGFSDYFFVNGREQPEMPPEPDFSSVSK